MAQEWREELGKRNRTSKTHRLHVDGAPTNSYSWDGIAGAPMHYQDAGGNWQDIDSTLVPSSRSIVGFGNPAYEMVENEYEMFVLDELNSGVPLVRYEAKHTDYYVQFAPHNLEWSNDLDQLSLIATPATTPTDVTASQAKWPDCYGTGLDLRFVATAGRMGKWLDIATALANPPQFIIDGGNPVIQFSEILEFHNDLDVYIDGQEWNKRDEVTSAEEIEFRSPDGEVQFIFPVAMAQHEGELSETEPEEHDWQPDVQGETRLKKQGPNLYITVRIPWAWFQTHRFTYPVHIDTTVDKQVGATANDGRRYANTDFGTTDQNNQIGQISGKNYHMFALWTGCTWSGTIGSNSYIECYANAVGGNPLMNVYFVDEDSPAAPTTYSEFDADPLTTNYVAWDGAWTASTWEQSPSLQTPLQEITDSYTISNDNVMVQVKDDGSANNAYNAARDYSNAAGSEYAAKLHVEYTAGGGPAGVKTINDLAIASVKTINDLAIASVKTINDSAA